MSTICEHFLDDILELHVFCFSSQRRRQQDSLAQQTLWLQHSETDIAELTREYRQVDIARQMNLKKLELLREKMRLVWFIYFYNIKSHPPPGIEVQNNIAKLILLN